MRTRFVNTENVKRLNAGMSKLAKRGAEEACILVVDGRPGLGKTTTINRWAATNSCPYLRAKKEWTSSWVLKELLNSFNVNPPHSFQDKFAAALRELSIRQSRAQNEGRMFGLVIDEADHVSRSEKIMETIRDLSDLLEMPVILVGMGHLRKNLIRYPQIASRVSQYVEFAPASESDVQSFISEICEIDVDVELAKFIHRVSGGMNREIKEAIASIERFGKRQSLDGNALRLEDLAGQTLMNDRKSGQPIIVPEVVL